VGRHDGGHGGRSKRSPARGDEPLVVEGAHGAF
jgi:hypothetical protein